MMIVALDQACGGFVGASSTDDALSVSKSNCSFARPAPKPVLRLIGHQSRYSGLLAFKAAGYSQRDLAAEIGISQRMVAYYETQSDYPPTHLFPTLAKALGVSADQLLGIEKLKKGGRARDNRLWRRFSQVEKLPSPQRKQIVQILDTFLEREKLRQAK